MGATSRRSHSPSAACRPDRCTGGAAWRTRDLAQSPNSESLLPRHRRVGARLRRGRAMGQDRRDVPAVYDFAWWGPQSGHCAERRQEVDAYPDRIAALAGGHRARAPRGTGHVSGNRRDLIDNQPAGCAQAAALVRLGRKARERSFGFMRPAEQAQGAQWTSPRTRLPLRRARSCSHAVICRSGGRIPGGRVKIVDVCAGPRR